MHEMIPAIVGVIGAAVVIWLIVQLVNGRKPWACAHWGIGVLFFGHVLIGPKFSPTHDSTPDFLLFMFCIVGFLNSARAAQGERP